MAGLTRFAYTLESFFTPIHPEGKIPAIIAGVITLVMFLIDEAFGMFFLFITGWVLYFFRDPVRVTPSRDHVAVSPADGKIVDISEAIAPAELGYGDKKHLKISVFLNVCDVHVNRVPVSGKIIKAQYRPGKFLSADMDKASEDNERQCLVIKDDSEREIIFVQIAGLVARRIVCNAQEGMRYNAGDRYGIIRFGSRVDIYLPLGTTPLIEVGQYMIGGETVLAELCDSTETTTEPAVVAPSTATVAVEPVEPLKAE